LRLVSGIEGLGYLEELGQKNTQKTNHDCDDCDDDFTKKHDEATNMLV
jgi:hypothetical protein